MRGRVVPYTHQVRVAFAPEHLRLLVGLLRPEGELWVNLGKMHLSRKYTACSSAGDAIDAVTAVAVCHATTMAVEGCLHHHHAIVGGRRLNVPAIVWHPTRPAGPNPISPASRPARLGFSARLPTPGKCFPGGRCRAEAWTTSHTLAIGWQPHRLHECWMTRPGITILSEYFPAGVLRKTPSTSIRTPARA